jgi:hypothetical protein
MFFLGTDGHDFIYDRCGTFMNKFDRVMCNTATIRGAAAAAVGSAAPLTICIKIDFIQKYATELCEIAEPFILVSCSSMYSPIYHFKEETMKILANPNLIAWFSENNTAVTTTDATTKMRTFPAGLNFHNAELQQKCETVLLSLACGGEAAAATAASRKNILYCEKRDSLQPDHYCRTFSGITRNLLCEFLPWVLSEGVGGGFAPVVDIHHLYNSGEFSCLENYYKELATYQFLLCPFESTIDPFPRTWEALALGVIPIMLYNPITENLYRDFPIWFVRSWEEVTECGDLTEKYNSLWRGFERDTVLYKLSAEYWYNVVTAAGMEVGIRAPSFTAAAAVSPLPNTAIMQNYRIGSRIAFSFCVFGDNPIYYEGLKENVEIIRNEFPGSLIFIFLGNNAHKEWIAAIAEAAAAYVTPTPNPTTEIVFYETGHDGGVNTIFRYAPAIHTNIGFLCVRDADSIIGERDLWCIRDFLRAAPTHAAHVIRDHFYHRSKILGGLFGLTALGMDAVRNVVYDKIAQLIAAVADSTAPPYHHTYGDDERFLNENLYDILHSTGGGVLAHTNIYSYQGETRRNILCKNTLVNFCGNVVSRVPITYYTFLYNDPKILEIEPSEHFIQTIISMDVWREFTPADFDVATTAALYRGMMQFPYHHRSNIVSRLIKSFLEIENLEGCMAAYQLYAYCEIDELGKKYAPDVLKMAVEKHGYSIVFLTTGCTIPSPTADATIYIIYGNYADDWRAYPAAHTIYRNVWFYERDAAAGGFVACGGRWIEPEVWRRNIDRIFIMGLEQHTDRVYETKQELARMGAPLNKITMYLAKKDNTTENAYLGATKNHVDCIATAVEGGGNGVCLFLEDDFVFAGGANELIDRLEEFFRRAYEYDVCFLSASKLHERTALDDLVIYSKQQCTTSSGYFLRYATMQKVLDIVREGYEKLKITKDSVTYCIDRYWTKLQYENRMILFREKIGFQRPSMSKITGCLNTMLD